MPCFEWDSYPGDPGIFGKQVMQIGVHSKGFKRGIVADKKMRGCCLGTAVLKVVDNGPADII
ncbi:MAG: hypothetical protein A2075_14340 [Geobacteraceae bacterium GWC2_58_44]|nr:MAG: hypothetical protein A2075_14340 [Geobacteraceae bacterium GWC2_58_44]